MCRFVILFGLLFGLSSLSWSQVRPDLLEDGSFKQLAGSALEKMSPEQREGALIMLRLFSEEFPMLEARLSPASTALEQTETPLLNLSPSILAIQEASNREVFTWKMATLGTAAAAVSAFGYLLYLGVSGHIRP